VSLSRPRPVSSATWASTPPGSVMVNATACGRPLGNGLAGDPDDWAASAWIVESIIGPIGADTFCTV